MSQEKATIGINVATYGKVRDYFTDAKQKTRSISFSDVIEGLIRTIDLKNIPREEVIDIIVQTRQGTAKQSEAVADKKEE